MFVPATAAPHLWKKTPASLGQFKNRPGQKRIKLQNGLHKKKQSIIGSMKKCYIRRRNIGKGLDSYRPCKNILKKAPHQTYFVCSSLLMMVANGNRKGSIYGNGILPCVALLTDDVHSQVCFTKSIPLGRSITCASVLRPDFRPKRCHHPCTMPKDRDGNPTTTWLLNGSSLPMYSNV